MDELEELLNQRDYYDEKMGEVLNGTLHLKKNWEQVNINEEQKKKDLFLFKYYEFHFNRLDEEIQKYINS